LLDPIATGRGRSGRGDRIVNLLCAHTPGAAFDWSGSILVVISLLYLFRKSLAYWHFSNASLLPYFVLWASSGQFMLAGLQVSYLVFGLYGLSLWHLERRHRQGGAGFHERFCYNLGWVLSLAIFLYTIVITRFTDGCAWLQFLIVALSPRPSPMKLFKLLSQS
jgi:nicotinamide mononucleotide transporter